MPYQYVGDNPQVVEERGGGLAGYAFAKYLFIFLIVLAILVFAAWYIIPKF